MGWISDFIRLAWGFLYWNTRKAVYRWRPTGRGCPCQHPSDSGLAWETGCAAMIHWNQPARFRRLCPLLQQTSSGVWRCSVNRQDVRPFWGRALTFYGSSALIIYLTVTLAAFVFLRTVGYRVTYLGVLWPPAWSKFTRIRTEMFLLQYENASAAGDMQTALISLSTAYGLAPQHYATGHRLAQLWQVGQPGFSDQIYRRLLNDHPAEAEGTAQSWFRALLARGDFAMIEVLASERIAADPEQSGAWLNAFLVANRRTGDAKARQRLEVSAKLTDEARFLLQLRATLAEKASPAEKRAQLLKAEAEARTSLSFFHVYRELIARGYPQDALQSLESRPGLLGVRDQVSLRMDALAALGWTTTLQREVENLLTEKPGAVLLELVSAHLIRYPDARLRGMVFERLERDSSPVNQENYAAYLSLFSAAAAGRDKPRLHWVTARIKTMLKGDFRSIDAVGEALLTPKPRPRIENYLPVLQPLPLEVSYALFDHYSPVAR